MRPATTYATFALIAGLILLPVAIFLFGQLAAGSYDGPAGLPGFLGDIYGDLLRGKLLAWTIVLSPAALVSIWWAVVRFGLGDSAPGRRKSNGE